MENNIQSILFITPFYGHTGSEVALFNIVENWPSNNDRLAVATIYEKGVLAKKNKANIIHYCFDNFFPIRKNFILRFFYSIANRLRKINFHRDFLDYVVNDFRPDIVVLNTLIMSEYLCYFEKRDIQIILYVHEMDWTFSHFNAEQLKSIVTIPHKIFCCSESSKKGFEMLGRNKQINTVYPGIDFSCIDITKNRNEVCFELGIPVNSIIIGMSGSLDYNKDPQSFVQTAALLLTKNSSYFFVWIGGELSTGDAYFAQQLASSAGISDKILFTGQLQDENYYNLLRAIDCFFLTSRFDSFPLVMLEASYLKKPIVGFNSGGITEFIKEGTGRIISYRNIITAADEIHAYLEGRDNFKPDLALQEAMKFNAVASGLHFYQFVNNNSCG